MQPKITIGLDIAKHVFQVHGVDASTHKPRAFLQDLVESVTTSAFLASARDSNRPAGPISNNTRYAQSVAA